MTQAIAPCSERPTGSRPGALVARRVPFDAIPRETWDRLLAVTARATPFDRWTFHRAWWDAYGKAAHEEYLVCLPGDAGLADSPVPDAAGSAAAGSAAAGTGGNSREALDPDAVVAIAPLMHRHEVEPDDAVLRTVMRHESATHAQVPERAKAVFFGASYHADYATLLCDPADLPAAAAAVVHALACGAEGEPPSDWDLVDLRRLRDDDPARDALSTAFCTAPESETWTVGEEQEDVCPVLRLETGDWEAYLGTLSSKDRHEVRRKLRRLEAAGDVQFAEIDDSATTVDEFVAIHQARWGASGLFPDTEGGRRSRRFLERLAELEGPDGTLRFGRLAVNGRTIFMCAGFHQDGTTYYYNAGSDPDASSLSPGVVGVAYYLRQQMEAGTRVFDFLRGDEEYKYRWGAVDEPIYRLIVTRLGR